MTGGPRHFGDLPEYMKSHEVAALFGVSGGTVAEWALKGRIASVRTPGGCYRFPTRQVLALRYGHPDTRGGGRTAGR